MQIMLIRHPYPRALKPLERSSYSETQPLCIDDSKRTPSSIPFPHPIHNHQSTKLITYTALKSANQPIHIPHSVPTEEKLTSTTTICRPPLS